MIKITVPFVAPSLNNWYAGTIWKQRKITADLWHEAIWIICIQDKIKPVKDYPVCITTKSYFKINRQRDTINYMTANKLAEDGFVKAGILIDDNTKYVYRHIVEAPEYGGKENYTEITISV